MIMKRPNGFVLLITMFVCFGALISGYITGVVSGILEMDGFKEVFSSLYNTSSEEVTLLMSNDSFSPTHNSSSFCGSSDGSASCGTGNGAGSDSQIGLIVGVFQLGSGIGSLLGGWLSDRFSRKHGLEIATVGFVAGAVVMASSYHVWLLIAGRLLNGIGNGAIYMIMPVYVSEVTPKDSRGMLGSFIGPTYLGGYLLALCTNVGYTQFPVGWRVALVMPALGGLVYAAGLLFMPHTPRWLVKRQRDHEALMVLSKINKHRREETFVDTCFELKELQESVSGSRHVLKEFFQWKYVCRFLVLMVIFIVAPLTGISIISYSATIFCEVQISPFIASLLLGLVLLMASVLLILTIDKAGRKALFLSCILLEIVVGFAVSVLVQLCATPSGVVAYIIVVLICLYSFGYASAWLILPWVINSEVFPTNIRGLTVGVSTCIYWLVSFVINLATPIIIGSPLKLHGLFYILSILNFFAFFFILFALPETKGVSLEMMDALFSQSFWQRSRPQCCKQPPLNSSIEEDEGKVNDIDSKYVTELGPVVLASNGTSS